MLPKPPVTDDGQGIDMDKAYAELALDPELRKQGWNLPDLDQSRFNPNINLDAWEDRIVWNSTTSKDTHPETSAAGAQQGQENQQPQIAKSRRIEGHSIPYTNQELIRGDWTKAIIWDERTPHQQFAHLEIFDNDPNLVKSKIEAAKQDEESASAPPAKKRRLPLAHLGQQLDLYNLSNDRIYENLKEKKKVVRQTFGNLEVQHAWPALKLQLPYYRTSLTKSEARSYHRPSIQFPQNVVQTFSKVRTAKKNKSAEKPVGPAAGPALGPSRQRKHDNPVKNLTELSLKDTTPYVLTEFSVSLPAAFLRLLMLMGSLMRVGGVPSHHVEYGHGKHPCQLLSQSAS